MNISGRTFPGIGTKTIQKLIKDIEAGADIFHVRFLSLLTRQELLIILCKGEDVPNLKNATKHDLITLVGNFSSTLDYTSNKEYIIRCLHIIHTEMTNLKKLRTKKYGTL